MRNELIYAIFAVLDDVPCNLFGCETDSKTYAFYASESKDNEKIREKVVQIVFDLIAKFHATVYKISDNIFCMFFHGQAIWFTWEKYSAWKNDYKIVKGD